MIQKFKNPCIPNDRKNDYKDLESKKYGVSVKIMPAKIAGCFQPQCPSQYRIML